MSVINGYQQNGSVNGGISFPSATGGFTSVKKWTWASWVRFLGTTPNATSAYIFATPSSESGVALDSAPALVTYSSGYLQIFHANDSVTNRTIVTIPVAFGTDNNWHHYAISMDVTGANPEIQVVVDGTVTHITSLADPVLSDYHQNGASNMEVTTNSASFRVFKPDAGSAGNVSLGEVYFQAGVALDFTDSAVLAKFYIATGPQAVSLGATGSTPTGSQAQLYITDVDPTVNNGSLGAGSLINTLGTDTTGPTFGTSGSGTGTASLTLPMFETTILGTSSPVLPMFTLDATMDETITGALVTLPMFTLDATGLTGETATGVETLPQFTMDASGSAAQIGAADLSLPQFTMDATGLTGHTWNADVSLPMFTLAAYGPNEAFIDLPMFDTESSGVVGVSGDAANNLPVFTVTSDGTTPATGAGASDLPMFVVIASGYSSSVTDSFNVEMPMFQVLGTGITGSKIDAALVLPMFSLDSHGYSAGVYTASIEMPMFGLEAIGYSSLPDIYRAWAINLHNLAITEYEGFAFASLVVLGDEVYAAGAQGLVKLDTSGADNGAPIAARVTTSKPDFGSSFMKRVPRAYVSMETDGAMEFHTYTTEDGLRRYLLPWSEKTGLNQQRAPIGKGPKSRYWQFGFANRDGADFTIDSIVIRHVQLPRRFV